MMQDYLLWLLPSGWLVSLIQWFVGRKRFKTQLVKDQTSDLLEMGASLRSELLNLQTEVIELYEKIRVYNQAISVAGTCNNDSRCPVISVLQNSSLCPHFGGEAELAGAHAAETID